MNNLKKLDDTLKLLSKKQGKSQLDLAKYLGYSKGAVNQWYSGLTEPNIETLIKISKFFNVSLDYLLTGEEKVENCILINKNTYEKILNVSKELNSLLKNK